MDSKVVAARLRALAESLEHGTIIPKQHVVATLVDLRSELESTRTASQAVKLDRKTLRDVNRKLDRKGLDGNKLFRSFGLGLGEIVEVLGREGIFIDDVIQKPRSPGGQNTYPLRRKWPLEDFGPFDPGAIVGNSMLTLSWHQFEETGNWEMIAYLS